MSEPNYFPIKQLDDNLLLPLMEEEEKAWMSDLGWDYSSIRQILISFIRQKLLPGFVAVAREKEAIGYAYFLVNQAKGIIGALYVSKTSRSQEVVEELLSLSISCLKEEQNIKRVEAQIMPFHNMNLTAAFTQHGFSYYPRYYLVLDLDTFANGLESPSAHTIVPWDSGYLERAAEMTMISYRDQTDAEICEDYRSKAGCASYLRSLVENPGCGVFMPEASYISLNAQNAPCGYVICCRISSGAGMIPQIAVHPSQQGQGLGNALMIRTFEQLRAMGFHSISLTATKKNQRAFDWYQRLGFRIRKEFGAYVWERQ
jgi:ribosomal protein S18 acetylase RimI-like enzyme